MVYGQKKNRDGEQKQNKMKTEAKQRAVGKQPADLRFSPL